MKTIKVSDDVSLVIKPARGGKHPMQSGVIIRGGPMWSECITVFQDEVGPLIIALDQALKALEKADAKAAEKAGTK